MIIMIITDLTCPSVLSVRLSRVGFYLEKTNGRRKYKFFMQTFYRVEVIAISLSSWNDQ